MSVFNVQHLNKITVFFCTLTSSWGCIFSAKSACHLPPFSLVKQGNRYISEKCCTVEQPDGPTFWRDVTDDVPLTLSDDEASFKPEVAPIRLLLLLLLLLLLRLFVMRKIP